MFNLLSLFKLSRCSSSFLIITRNLAFLRTFLITNVSELMHMSEKSSGGG